MHKGCAAQAAGILIEGSVLILDGPAVYDRYGPALVPVLVALPVLHCASLPGVSTRLSRSSPERLCRRVMACRVAVQCVDHSVLPCFSVAEGEWFGEIEFVLNQVGRASASESGTPSYTKSVFSCLCLCSVGTSTMWRPTTRLHTSHILRG